jgi:gluconate 2-dehydrogenase gamma chain
MDIDRRAFMRQLCCACGSIAILPACTTRFSTWRFLTEEEARLLISISEQFVPADGDPGATDANVVNFFDKQLVGHYLRHQETYRKGLQNMNATALKVFHKRFVDLEWDQQTKFLETMEAGELPEADWGEMDQRMFFRMLLDHTMQAFYGSPRHGGNCNYVSFKMLKIDYPHVIGQNRYSSHNIQPNLKAL